MRMPSDSFPFSFYIQRKGSSSHCVSKRNLQTKETRKTAWWRCASSLSPIIQKEAFTLLWLANAPWRCMDLGNDKLSNKSATSSHPELIRQIIPFRFRCIRVINNSITFQNREFPPFSTIFPYPSTETMHSKLRKVCRRTNYCFTTLNAFSVNFYNFCSF